MPAWVNGLAYAIAAAIPLLSILWALQAPITLGLEVAREQFLACVLGLAISLSFLNRATRGGRGTILIFCALLALATFSFVGIDYARFQFDFPYLTVEMQILSAIATLLAAIAIWRTGGWILLVIIGLFFVYTLFGAHLPAPLTASPATLPETLVYLTFDPNAILGTPLSVVASIVIVFIFFGKLLVKTGCGEFFIDLAMALMGRRRGGAAKISIVSSALFGSISGSAISNVVTTGVMTIPLMKRSGYNSAQSGAIETIASTGGQLMPPIMGAAAFLMAQSLEIPYSEVVIAAIIPAVLYYVSVFCQVDLIAARDQISTAEKETRPVVDILKEGWHLILPFVVLLGAMFQFHVPAELAALYGAVSIVIGGALRSYQGHRLSIKGLVACFPETGKSLVELTMIVAGAGFVIGLLNLSGGGFALTLALIDLGGTHIAALLAVSAGICIFLGMGMPTSGVYVLLAALVAPSLVETGIAPLAAHMFILYFGMMSMITPPIALAAFSAATISGASPMRTGLAAMQMGWVAYVVPVLFIFSPALLMNGSTAVILQNLFFAVFGVYLISVAVVGYFARPQSAPFRLFLLIAGIAALLPSGTLANGPLPMVIATLLGGSYLLWDHLSARRAAVT
ncbi:MAG: TRAP transporter fused permease subunit [Sneathiella sp.]|uniref:TRAP transporter permease n=1 Tax=Sneathiella sp. TaxID=1964365 RepID=UPI0030035820